MNQKEINKQIFERLKRLEAAVFGNKKRKIKLTKSKIRDFKGTTGGIRLLISKNFFKNKKRTFSEIKRELNRNGYYSSR